MYKLASDIKKDPVRRWALPDRIFFACGACHILAYAFMKAYPVSDFKAVWIKPAKGYTGNHIVAVHDNCAFDFHGYSNWDTLQEHINVKANRWWPGWSAELINLPKEALVCGPLSQTYEGLRLREPKQYLHDALPRAERFVQRYPPPPEAGLT